MGPVQVRTEVRNRTFTSLQGTDALRGDYWISFKMGLAVCPSYNEKVCPIPSGLYCHLVAVPAMHVTLQTLLRLDGLLCSA
jgi:hypothetical protein